MQSDWNVRLAAPPWSCEVEVTDSARWLTRIAQRSLSHLRERLIAERDAPQLGETVGDFGRCPCEQPDEILNGPGCGIGSYRIEHGASNLLILIMIKISRRH